MGNISRSVAFLPVLVFLSGTLVGSLLPESGNVLAHILGISNSQSHIFNPLFLAVGIVGIVLALRFRHKRGRK